jgi:spermidine/putrescine transport system permease protein
MTDAPLSQGQAPRIQSRDAGGLVGWFHRSETLRGYLLLSPTLILMTIGIAIPVLILIAMSFWTREGFGFDMTPTVANYARIANEPIFGVFLTRSFGV